MDVSRIISQVNYFIANKHTLDDETIKFLSSLKLSLVELVDSSRRKNNSDKLTELQKLVRSVGMSCFVNAYYIFKAKYKEKITGTILDEMFELGGANTDASARTKSSVGLKLFKLNLNLDALELILNSDKVDPMIAQKAKKILLEENLSNFDSQ